MFNFLRRCTQRGSLNLEVALIVSLLILVAVGTLTYMASGVDKQYNKAGTAVGDGGGGSSDPIPTVVTGLVATGGNGKVTLSGYTATDDVAVTEYKIWYNTTGVTPIGAEDQTTSNATVDVTGLTNGDTYYFWVAAEDADGNVGDKSTAAFTKPTTALARQFLALGVRKTGANTIAASADGDNWAAGGSVFDTTGYTAIWDGSKWIAGGLTTTGTGILQTSTDGINWTPRLNGTIATDAITGVAYGNVGGSRVYVAVGGRAGTAEAPNVVWTSSDGENWTGRGNTLKMSSAKSVAYANGRFVLTGTSATAAGGTQNVAYSDDGVNWTGVNGVFETASSSGGQGVKYLNGKWIVMGKNAVALTSAATSDDGATWTPVASSTVLGTAYSVAYDGSKYVIVGGGGTNSIATATDITGIWTGGGKPAEIASNRSIVWTGSKFIVGSAITTVGGTDYGIATSTDGASWTNRGGGIFAAGTSSGVNCIAWNGK